MKKVVTKRTAGKAIRAKSDAPPRMAKVKAPGRAVEANRLPVFLSDEREMALAVATARELQPFKMSQAGVGWDSYRAASMGQLLLAAMACDGGDFVFEALENLAAEVQEGANRRLTATRIKVIAELHRRVTVAAEHGQEVAR